MQYSLLSPERVEALQGQWVRLLTAYGVPTAGAYPVFDALVARHAEPQRHYHTLEHVAEVLRVVGRLQRWATDPLAVQLAAWFHDAVYDPRGKSNEEESATLAQQQLKALGLPPPTIEEVARLIRATDHHAAPEDANAIVLIDADLAILAASEVRYARFAADIRREYAHVLEEAYRAGRAAVLGSFLARPRIYLTETMFAEGEEAARRNLTAEREQLLAPNGK